MAAAASDRPGDPGDERDLDRDAAWVARITALAIIGFALTWTLVVYLAEKKLYGPPQRVLEVNLYLHYAQNVLAGLVPYRDFAFEYPPLALVPILGTSLVAGSPLTEEGYRHAFELFVAATGMVTTIFIMWTAAALELGRRELIAAAAIVAVSPLLLGPLMLARYDLWPALFVAAALWLLATRREAGAAAALGLGILAKAYPVVMVPFFLVYIWRRRGGEATLRFVTILGAVVVVGVIPFLWIAPEGIIDAFTRSFERPLQVESIGAAVLYVVSVVSGLRLRLNHEFDSYNLSGPIPQQVATVQSVLLVVALVGLFLLFLRGPMSLDRVAIGSAAAICAFVALGKVLSPQYLIWLVAPLAIVRAGKWAPHLIALAVAIVLTGLYYPRFYNEYYRQHQPLWVAIVLGRDLILVAITGYLAVRLARREAVETVPSQAEPALEPAGAPAG